MTPKKRTRTTTQSRYYCSVPTCKKDPLHSSFRLPTDPSLAKEWIKQLNVDEDYIRKSRKIHVCEAHFESDSIFITKSLHRRLANRTIPTLNLPTKESYVNISYSKERKGKLSSSSENEVIFVEDIQTQSANAPQNDNYTDLVANIIFNSLKSSPCQYRTPTIMEQTSILSSNNTSTDTQQDVTIASIPSSSSGLSNIKSLVKKKKCKTNLITNKACLKYSDYARTQILKVQLEIQELLDVPEALEAITLKMYLLYPQTYKMLRSCLKLPSVSLTKGVFNNHSMLTDPCTLFAQALQKKVSNMSEKQKHCVICLGELQVRKNLYYDITCDKLLGISDINDIQKPEPASKALVLTVQGIFANWEQPIAVAYVGSSESTNVTNVKEWIDRNISNIMKNGYKVRAYVSDTYNFSTIGHYQINQTGKQTHPIYCIYDASSLFKLLYYNFSTYDYSFSGGVARMQHIIDFYKQDIMKQIRLTPKLTEKHIIFSDYNELDLEIVKDVLSLQTAAAMSTYIDFGVLDPSAKSTVQFIRDMGTLLEVLLCNNFDKSIKVESGKTHVEFLRHMLLFFYNFKPFHSSLKTELPNAGTFVEHIQMTIKSVLLLYEDIERNGDSETLPTQRLSLDSVRSFFDKAKMNSNDCHGPTCKKMNTYFKESTIINVLKSTGKTNCLDVEKALNQAMLLINEYKIQLKTIGEPIKSLDMKINKSEYQTLDLRKRDAIILLSGFILKKCHDRHANCVDMKNYTCIVLHDTSSICKPILDEIQKGICVVPQENFIEFVEMLEIQFRLFMTKPVLRTANGKLIKGLLAALQRVCFPMPCPCFPILYAKKLFLRIRIYNVLKYNNSNIASGYSQLRLKINDL